MTKLKSNKGISLIALIITIALMIILASTAIYTGGIGAIEQSKYAKFTQNISQIQASFEFYDTNHIDEDINDLAKRYAVSVDNNGNVMIPVIDTTSSLYLDINSVINGLSTKVQTGGISIDDMYYLDTKMIGVQAKNNTVQVCNLVPTPVNAAQNQYIIHLPTKKIFSVKGETLKNTKIHSIYTAKAIMENSIIDKVTNPGTILQTDTMAPSQAIITGLPSTTNATLVAPTVTMSDNVDINITASKYTFSTLNVVYTPTDAVWNTATAFTSNPQALQLSGTIGQIYYLYILSVDTSGNKFVTKSNSITFAP